jgi:hypothetical protein
VGLTSYKWFRRLARREDKRMRGLFLPHPISNQNLVRKWADPAKKMDSDPFGVPCWMHIFICAYTNGPHGLVHLVFSGGDTLMCSLPPCISTIHSLLTGGSMPMEDGPWSIIDRVVNNPSFLKSGLPSSRCRVESLGPRACK